MKGASNAHTKTCVASKHGVDKISDKIKVSNQSQGAVSKEEVPLMKSKTMRKEDDTWLV